MKTWALIRDAVETSGTAVLVTVVSTAGSVPREAGAQLIVTPDGFHGTIGGGALEWQALAKAQALLHKPAAVKYSSHALGPELGQCCGGRMQLSTEVFDASSLAKLQLLSTSENETRVTLFLYGAGHVGRALVMALAPLSFNVKWIDNRPNAFPRFVPENVTCLAPDNPLSPLENADDGSMVWIMSHSHALDLEIADAALRHPHVAHVGLIGSLTKRARFEKRLLEGGVSSSRLQGLICPIGVTTIRSKEPAAIALSAAAQLQSLLEVQNTVSLQNEMQERQRHD